MVPVWISMEDGILRPKPCEAGRRSDPLQRLRGVYPGGGAAQRIQEEEPSISALGPHYVSSRTQLTLSEYGLLEPTECQISLRAVTSRCDLCSI